MRAFSHPEQAQAGSGQCLRDIETLSIILDHQAHLGRISMDEDTDCLGRRVLARVRQRFLRHPVERGFDRLGKARQARPGGVYVNHKSAGPAHLESQAVQRLLESKIVEYARAQPARDALHTLQGGRHQAAQNTAASIA